MEDLKTLSLEELYKKISKLNSYICFEGAKICSDQSTLSQLIYMKECIQEEIQARHSINNKNVPKNLET